MGFASLSGLHFVAGHDQSAIKPSEEFIIRRPVSAYASRGEAHDSAIARN